jgi:3,4-dihydroxy 2-butanone 4-phosphate synthase/GTP cyclohydrolase II
MTNSQPQHIFAEQLSSPEDIIDEARNGRMFILVDDEDRENEGDLIIPAQMATPDMINFMAKEGRGLICLALTGDKIDRLELPMMEAGRPNRGSRMGTAFTVSIEAAEGVTTGISAADRAHTIQVAINEQCRSSDLVTPGHVFPLRARDGGVLVRAGHTEAAVDIARMAGLIPASVICEIMRDDGTMARLPDLIPFAKQHKLKIGTIADLIAYRRRTEKIIERVISQKFISRYADGKEFDMHVYANTIEYGEHVALVLGDVADGAPVLTRMHAVNFLNDVIGGGTDPLIALSLEQIATEGRGVLVLLRDQNKQAVSQNLTGVKPPETMIREYGIGAQILCDLGVKQMILITNNPKFVAGLDGYDLHIVGHRPITK